MKKYRVAALLLTLSLLGPAAGAQEPEADGTNCGTAGDPGDTGDSDPYPPAPPPDACEVRFDTENAEILIVPGANWSDTVVLARQDSEGEFGTVLNPADVAEDAVLARVLTSADGTFVAEVPLPQDATAGEFSFLIVGKDRAGRDTVVRATTSVPEGVRPAAPAAAHRATAPAAPPLATEPSAETAEAADGDRQVAQADGDAAATLLGDPVSAQVGGPTLWQGMVFLVLLMAVAFVLIGRRVRRGRS